MSPADRHGRSRKAKQACTKAAAHPSIRGPRDAGILIQKEPNTAWTAQPVGLGLQVLRTRMLTPGTGGLALQIVCCLACLACAAHWAHTWAAYRTHTFLVYAILQSVNFAIFISLSGTLLSSFLLFAPRITPKLAE